MYRELRSQTQRYNMSCGNDSRLLSYNSTAEEMSYGRLCAKGKKKKGKKSSKDTTVNVKWNNSYRTESAVMKS